MNTIGKGLSAFAAVAAILSMLVAIAPSEAGPTAAPSAPPSPSPSSTPTPSASPPIEIDTCTLNYSGDYLVGTSSGIQIKFTNNSKSVVNVINFQIAEGKQSGVIRDVGSFAPGLEVTHNYKEGSGQMMVSPILSHPHLDCVVQSVQFADGSVWTPPQITSAVPAPVASSAPQSSGPKSGGLAVNEVMLTFTETGANFAQFLSITDTDKLGTLKESDNCAGIAKVAIVGSSSASASVQVSPIGQGFCGITLQDASNNSLMIQVAVTPNKT